MGAQSSSKRGRGSSPRSSRNVVSAAPAPFVPPNRDRGDSDEAEIGPGFSQGRWAHTSLRAGASPVASPSGAMHAWSGEGKKAAGPRERHAPELKANLGHEFSKAELTTSTTSPASLSRPPSRPFSSSSQSLPISAYSSRPGSSGSYLSRPGSSGSNGTNSDELASTDARLGEARQRARNSLEALQMELKGFGGAVGVRYASWPEGCSVRISCENSTPSSNSVADDSQSTGLLAKFVRYDPSSNACEVRLQDDSMRIVPAQRVTRSFAKSRATRSTTNSKVKVADVPSADEKNGSETAEKESAAAKVHQALGQKFPAGSNAPPLPALGEKIQGAQQQVREQRGGVIIEPQLVGRAQVDPGLLV